MANGNTNIYDVAPTVLADEGIDPRAVHMSGIKERQAAQAAKNKESQKKVDEAYKSIEGLEAKGWRKHDATRSEKRKGLRSQMTEWGMRYGTDVFSGEEGQKRYEKFQDGIADYNTFELYSGQLQKEYETQANKALTNAGDYTEDSLKNFTEWKDLPYDEQLKAGLPLLVETEDAADWFADVSKLSIPYKEYGRERVGEGDLEGFLVSSEGMVVDKEAMRKNTEAYISTGITGSNKYGKRVYEENLEELRNSPDGRSLDDTTPNELTGLTELEEAAKQMAIEEVYDLRLTSAQEKHKRGLQQMKGETGEDFEKEEITPGKQKVGAYEFAYDDTYSINFDTGDKGFAEINVPYKISENGQVREGGLVRLSAGGVIQEGYKTYPKDPKDPDTFYPISEAEYNKLSATEKQKVKKQDVVKVTESQKNWNKTKQSWETVKETNYLPLTPEVKKMVKQASPKYKALESQKKNNYGI